MGELNLTEILQKVEELPALSQVAYQVFRMTADPKTTILELTETITQDQVLTAKVLRMANSAYYGYTRKIISIKEALVILGFNTVRNLVMAASMYNVMNTDLDGYFLPKGELWRHSMSSALIARSLAKKTDSSLSDRAFIAGLIHDIGKIVLSTYLKDAFSKVIDKVKSENIPFMDAEKQILGYDHAQIGAMVAEKWNLPDELIESIALHHTPSLAVINPKLVSLTHVADALSMSMGMGLGGDGMFYPFDGFVNEQLQLTESILEETITDIADSMMDSETIAMD